MFITQSALGQNQWWRYAATMLVTAAAFLAGHVPLIFVVRAYAQNGGFSDADLDRLLATGGLGQIGVGTNLSLIVMLLPFAAALFSLLLCTRFIHVRSYLSVLTSRPRFDLTRVWTAALIWFVVAGGLVLWAIPEEKIIYQFTPGKFLPLLVIALLLLPLQVAAEEVMFRGYLMQGVARFFSRPVWPLLITTLAFAMLHLTNPEFQNGFAQIAPIYLLFSLFFGLLAVLDGGLELPIGAHLGNNMFTALVLSTSDGAMSTASLYQTQVSEIISNLWTLLFAVPIVMCFLHLMYRFDWAMLMRRQSHCDKPV